MELQKISFLKSIDGHINVSNYGLNEQQVIEARSLKSCNSIPFAKLQQLIKIILFNATQVEFSFTCLLLIVLHAITPGTPYAQMIALSLYGQLVILALYDLWTSNAKKKLLALISYSYPVIRDGKISEVEKQDLVAGDFLILKKDQKIPAHACVVESSDLAMNEEIYSRSSVMIDKTCAIIEDESSLDPASIVYKNTSVVSGWGIAFILPNIDKDNDISLQDDELGKMQLPLTEHQIEWVLFSLACIVLSYFQVLLVSEAYALILCLLITHLPYRLKTIFTVCHTIWQKNMMKQAILYQNFNTLHLLDRCSVLVINESDDCNESIMVRAHKLGIQIIMLSDKNKEIALLKARTYGILFHDGLCIDGELFNEFSDQELIRTLTLTSVYYSMNNETKIRIINAWQRVGKIVAFVGNCDNDLEVAKHASITISFNESSSNRLKELSNVILLSNSLENVILAFEGNRLFRKKISFIKALDRVMLYGMAAMTIYTLSIGITMIQLLPLLLVTEFVFGTLIAPLFFVLMYRITLKKYE